MMENLKGKTAQEVFDAVVDVYSDKHNRAYSSFCDLGELLDFIERLRSKLGIEPPKGEFVTAEVRAEIKKGVRVILRESAKVLMEPWGND